MHVIYLSQNTHPVQTNNSPYYVVFKKESLARLKPDLNRTNDIQELQQQQGHLVADRVNLIP